MEFRRNASERRRRVLIEENLQESGATATAPRSRDQQTPWQNYSQSAQRSHQPHLTDLLPKRRWSLTVLGLSGLAVIAGLLALYGKFFVESHTWGFESPAAFDLNRSDSLAGWFSSTALAGGAFIAVLIYLMRRHRVDDYRGRYRIWIWLGALLLLCSVETIVGLRHPLGEWICAWQPIGSRFAPSATTMLLVGLFGFVSLVRGAIELRRSRGAICLLALALISYGFVTLDELLHWLPVGEMRTIADGTSILLGHYSLIASLLVYARYVYLDAHGCLPARRLEQKEPKRKRAAKKKDVEKPTDAQPTETRRRSDLDRQEPEKKPTATITAAAAAPKTLRVSTPAPATNDATGLERRLSKAERKKLKRMAG